MKIYLIRHGETDWNKKRLLQGKQDIPLNEKGIRLAKLTGEKLSQIKFDKVYASPLKRAYETALLVTGGQYPVEKEPRLEEIGYGVCEGTSRDQDDPNLRVYFERPELYRAPEGGESIEALYRRTWSFLQELIRNPENADKTILLASHGAALQGLMCMVRNQPVSAFWKERELRNCAVTILNVQDGKITIEQENVLFYDENAI